MHIDQNIESIWFMLTACRITHIAFLECFMCTFNMRVKSASDNMVKC